MSDYFKFLFWFSCQKQEQKCCLFHEKFYSRFDAKKQIYLAEVDDPIYKPRLSII